MTPYRIRKLLWPTRKLTQEGTTRLVAYLIDKIIIIIMKNHYYKFHVTIYHQEEGGATGLILTGMKMARVGMDRWMRVLRMRVLMKNHMKVYFLMKYVEKKLGTLVCVPKGLWRNLNEFELTLRYKLNPLRSAAIALCGPPQ